MPVPTTIVRKFMVDCSFQGGNVSKVPVYVGSPKDDVDPVHNQDTWFSKERGGVLSENVKSIFKKLRVLSTQTMVPFADLCAYALKVAENKSKEDVDNKE